MTRLESQNSNTQPVTDSKVLGYLGRALSLEFSSGQHCLTQAALSKSRQEIAQAEQFVTLANEEFQRTNVIIDYMINLGASPAKSMLHSSIATSNIIESLQSCLHIETSLAKLYAEAAQHCLNNSLHQDHYFFSQLLTEKSAQLTTVQSWLTGFIANQQTT